MRGFEWERLLYRGGGAPALHSHVAVDSHILGFGLVFKERVVQDLIVNVHFPGLPRHVGASQ